MRVNRTSLPCLKVALVVAALSLSFTSQGEALTLNTLSFNSDIAWLDYQLPDVQIKTEAQASHPVWPLLTVPLIKQISFNVARLLYDEAHLAPKLPSLKIVLSSFDGVAYKNGDFNGAIIKVSRDYLEKFSLSHDPDVLTEELIGILYHEIAHAYQLDDHNYAEIGPVIEGIADVVRIQAGYVELSHRKVGGNYDSGYKKTAFYLDWLIKHHDEISLSVINQQLDPNDTIKWSWQTFAEINQLNLNESWQQYQLSLK